LRTEIDPSLTKIPPHDLNAEREILGNLIQYNDALSDVLEVLSRDGMEFYHTAHKTIYRAIVDMLDKGEACDIVTLCDFLQKGGTIDKVGGYVAISKISDYASSAVNIQHYCRIIKERYVERTIISETYKLMESAYNPAVPTQEKLEEAQKAILSLSLSKDQNSLQDAKIIAKETHKMIEERHQRGTGMVIGMSTGFDKLDNLTGGMNNGDLWIVAARPGMGKSAFAVDVAYHAALRGHKSVIFSLEMPRESLMVRILAGMTGYNSRLLSRGFVKPDQWQKVTQAAVRIGEAPLYIDDKPSITATEIMAKCRKLKGDKGLDFAVVDYLQLMRAPGKHESREQQVAEISRSMKMIAREIGIPVMALSQLNRQVEQRPNRKPNLGDLRESGAIEQDADVIAFIYRDEVYNKSEDNPEKGIAEIRVEKHRNGPTGAVKLRYVEQCTRFENLPDEYGR
jgi:replicative DNA helicase